MAATGKAPGFTQITRVSAAGSDNLLDPLSIFISEKEDKVDDVKEVEQKHSQVTQQSPETFRMPNFTPPTRSLSSQSSATNLTCTEYSNPNQLPASHSRKTISATVSAKQISPSTSAVTITPTTIASHTSASSSFRSNSELLEQSAGEPLLSGESMVMQLKDVYIHVGPARMIAGVLLMTNFRLKFVPSPSHRSLLISVNPSVVNWMNIPLACIDRIDKEKRSTKDSVSRGVTLCITCKDVRQVRISVNGKGNGNDDYETDRALSTMLAYTFPNHIKYLFAFSHCLPNDPAYISLLDPFDLVAEYTRLGILDSGNKVFADSPWRISQANRDFRLCKTYARVLIMPSRMSDEELYSVAAFRSGQRLPVLCWGDKESGATIWRSSQPKAGVSGSNLYDERFLELLAQSCAYHRTPLGARRPAEAGAVLHIVDCRPRASAMANRAAGAGYESQTNYPNTRLEFYNIPNIHVMRDSYKNLTAVVLSNSPATDCTFSKSVEDSQWLNYNRLVLKSSWDIANFIRKGQPVLVHCSHGWDRTAQVCSLSQLFLDSYYRTIDGFRALIEKEWCSFGHPFQLRCQHALDKSNRQEDEFSPIFIQFLDCVYQIQRQNKQHFEFNSRYLVALADQLYAGRFGTFLFSSDHDREAFRSRDCCLDVWTYLHHNRHIFTNPLFQDPNSEDTHTTHVLLPQLHTLLRNVVLWGDFFLRFAGLSSMIVAPDPHGKWLVDSNGMCLPSISSAEVSKIHPAYREDPEEGSSICSNQRCADLEVPCIVTADDLWEAAYREERAKREELEVAIRTLCMEHNIEGAVDKTALELNDMLKSILATTSHSHSHHTHSQRNAELDDVDVEDAEFASSDAFVDEDASGAAMSSFPSPPPSPPVPLESESHGLQDVDLEAFISAEDAPATSPGQHDSPAADCNAQYLL